MCRLRIGTSSVWKKKFKTTSTKRNTGSSSGSFQNFRRASPPFICGSVFPLPPPPEAISAKLLLTSLLGLFHFSVMLPPGTPPTTIPTGKGSFQRGKKRSWLIIRIHSKLAFFKKTVFVLE